ncbi:MAG TPA: GlsB/YeaQ/YmgE family stress response membrane protein [Solirubrobacterales bacterium]|nr:GlsB/YeaQ/YmgE family stress response membrane protein [Solirubrobacterales bacterium]
MELITFIIWLFVIGLIVGAIARLLVPGRQPMGVIGTALAGIAGSFVAGVLFWALADKPGKHPVLGFVLAVICAAAIVYFVAGPRRRVFGGGGMMGTRRRWL